MHRADADVTDFGEPEQLDAEQRAGGEIHRREPFACLDRRGLGIAVLGLLQIHDLDRERGFAGRQHLLDRLVVFQHETRAQDLVTLAQRAERPHERVHVQHALEQQRRGQRPAGLRRMEAIHPQPRLGRGERVACLRRQRCHRRVVDRLRIGDALREARNGGECEQAADFQLRCRSRRMRATTFVASSELPPSSKKLAVVLIRAWPSTSCQMAVNCASSALTGAT